MRLKLPRETTSHFLWAVLTLALCSSAYSQSSAPTSGEVMRARIMRAKALIAVRNHNAAIFELENIRRETSDTAVQGVANVLLMSCYLEQGDYRRAHVFLDQFFDSVKGNKPNSLNYYLVAGQVVRGARTQTERYSSLGLVPADKNLPNEAQSDFENLRDMLERVVGQAAELGRSKDQASSAFALLEEATITRSMLARDDYDSKRWKEELADARDSLVESRSVVVSVREGDADAQMAASDRSQAAVPATTPVAVTPEQQPTPEPITVVSPPQTSGSVAQSQTQTPAPVIDAGPTTTGTKPGRERRVGQAPQTQAADKIVPVQQTSGGGPKADLEPALLQVGALKGYAVNSPSPVYPPNAKSLRISGIVRVEMLINPDGSVSKITGVSGPELLKRAANDAALRWKFKPFNDKEGRPVAASGFLSFEFKP